MHDDRSVFAQRNRVALKEFDHGNTQGSTFSWNLHQPSRDIGSWTSRHLPAAGSGEDETTTQENIVQFKQLRPGNGVVGL